MKITKTICESALEILKAEGSQHKKGWLGVLNEVTNEPSQIESVGFLTHLILAQSTIFNQVAMNMLPKYMTDHPEIRNPTVALNSLMTQLCIRMIVYVYKHAMDVKELENMFDFEKEGKDNK